MGRRWFSFLVTGLMLGTLGASGLAQQVQLKNDPTYPLQIVSVSPAVSGDGTTLQGARVTVQNTGNVACVAFSVTLILDLSNSQTRKVTFREDHNALGYAKTHSPADDISPGQTYTMRNTTGVRVGAPGGATINGIEAGLHFVEMADGKKYGDDPDKLGELFRMMRWARTAERKRLLNLYNTQGLQALLSEVERQ